jgi:hypothetical protein
MLTRYPLLSGVKPTRNLYVYDSLEGLYLWINKQRDFGPAIHRTLEFTATALDSPFRTTPHIWRLENQADPQLWSFRWSHSGLALPGLSESAAVYAVRVNDDAVLVHWGNERGKSGVLKGLEEAVKRTAALEDFITARASAQGGAA